jgi:hypothetical protein
MKLPLWVFLAAVPVLILAEENAGSVAEPEAARLPLPEPAAPPARSERSAPWLGFRIVKPDESTTAHLPSLPPGIGFVIKSVDPGGPAEKAGVRALDIVWKFGDQMLVNEGQLATLLGHRKVGDEVVLSLFRSGQPQDVTIVLGEAPERRGRFAREVVDAAILPGEGGPMKVVNVGTRTASFSTDEGRAWIQRDGSNYKVVLHDPDGKLIYQGTLSDDDELESIPKDWRRRVCALRRGLDHALEERMVPVRPPRPRVVPADVPSP